MSAIRISDKFGIRLLQLQLFGTKKASPGSPNPVQSMAVPGLMKIRLQLIRKGEKSVV